MEFSEQNVTRGDIEKARNVSELERHAEREHKLVPVNREQMEAWFLEDANMVEQTYISAPTDEFSLRVRREDTEDGSLYTATQKDRGELHDGALERREITTAISQEAYEYYRAMNLPTVQKMRAIVLEGVTVDFYNDTEVPVLIEIEHPNSAVRAKLLNLMQHLTDDGLVDVSDDPFYTNEHIAHRLSGEKEPASPETLDAFAKKVTGEMVAQYVAGKKQVVAGLTGMSGSGKTTVTRAIQEHMTSLFGEEYRPLVLSTDDYHFGKTALEAQYGAPYTEWDAPQTYDTKALAADIAQLAQGTPLTKRHFDFETEEPVLDENAAATPFIIIEGLYAGSKDLAEVRDLHFTLPTGTATSIGRDVRRLVIENRANRAFPTPESRLRYQIETALPLYLAQETPARVPFSASSRALVERAFMLERLHAAE